MMPQIFDSGSYMTQTFEELDSAGEFYQGEAWSWLEWRRRQSLQSSQTELDELTAHPDWMSAPSLTMERP